MAVAEKVPWQELSLTADDCAELWGKCKDVFLREIACQPGFPERLTYRPATWKAGEVLEYRNTNRAGQRVRQRKSGNRASGSAGRGGQSLAPTP